ncbi:MAG: hypothetical protein KA020_03695 [Planctomycetes bacterium]|nr:hypothetical protein [Planctomycetota bacterium]MCC7066642.1 hypothetical protein [Planctomycetota bacterium]
MKHITRRRPDREVRFGTWRLLILHRAAFQVVSGGQLLRQLTRQGHKIQTSTLHDTLHGMVRIGMLHRVEAAAGSRDHLHYRISRKGRDHLAALRQELIAAYDEVVRGIDPEPADLPFAAETALSSAPDELAGIVAAVQNNERERMRMRAALERIQAIIADALR